LASGRQTRNNARVEETTTPEQRCCRRVLLWTPGDDFCGHALQRIAAELGAGPAIALHVWRAPHAVRWAGGAMLPPVPLEVIDPGFGIDPEVIAERKAELARAHGFEPYALAVEATGPLWRTVVDAAADRHARAIGAICRRSWREARLGRQLAGAAQVPVLVVEPGLPAAPAPRDDQRQPANSARTASAAGFARPA
jgi:hypothetical protein